MMSYLPTLISLLICIATWWSVKNAVTRNTQQDLQERSKTEANVEQRLITVEREMGAVKTESATTLKLFSDISTQIGVVNEKLSHIDKSITDMKTMYATKDNVAAIVAQCKNGCGL